VPGFTYKSYNFVNKDPVIDEIRTIYQASGVNYKWIEDNSGVTSTTLSAWFSGKTKRPQSATIEAVLRALGYKRAIVPFGEKQIHIVPAMEQSKPRDSVRHVVQMSKYSKRGKKHGKV
jgi:transcriptional regulator with XRE-family HTH domain